MQFFSQSDRLEKRHSLSVTDVISDLSSCWLKEKTARLFGALWWARLPGVLCVCVTGPPPKARASPAGWASGASPWLCTGSCSRTSALFLLQSLPQRTLFVLRSLFSEQNILTYLEGTSDPYLSSHCPRHGVFLHWFRSNTFW